MVAVCYWVHYGKYLFQPLHQSYRFVQCTELMIFSPFCVDITKCLLNTSLNQKPNQTLVNAIIIDSQARGDTLGHHVMFIQSSLNLIVLLF